MSEELDKPNKSLAKEMLEARSKKIDYILEAKRDLANVNAIVEDISKGLTPKQKAFLDKYAVHKDVVKALNEAKMGNHSASVNRYKAFLKTPEAQLYLQNIEELGFVEAVLTIEEIIEKARRVYDRAIEDGDYKACNEVLKFLGQYKGMTVDRKESTTVNINTSHTSGDKPEDVRSDITRFKEILSKAVTPASVLVKMKKPQG